MEKYRSISEGFDRSMVAMEAALKSGKQEMIKEALKMPILKNVQDEQLADLEKKLQTRLAELVAKQGAKEVSVRAQILS